MSEKTTRISLRLKDESYCSPEDAIYLVHQIEALELRLRKNEALLDGHKMALSLLERWMHPQIDQRDEIACLSERLELLELPQKATVPFVVPIHGPMDNRDFSIPCRLDRTETPASAPAETTEIPYKAAPLACCDKCHKVPAYCNCPLLSKEGCV